MGKEDKTWKTPAAKTVPLHQDLRLSTLSDLTKPDLWFIFLQADQNEDGKLSKLEFFNFAAHYREEIERAQYQKLSPEIDLDKDGALSKEELEKNLATWDIEGFPQELEREKFKIADADGNGKLEGEEWSSGHERSGFDPLSYVGVAHRPQEIVNMYGHGVSEKVLEAEAKSVMQSKDTDKDGKLNLKEFWYDYLRPEDDHDDEEPWDRNETFHDLDVQGNGDGMIDLHELKIWEGGFFFIEDSIDKILQLSDKDQDGEATFKDDQRVVSELSEAWHSIEESGVHLPLKGIIIRALGEHEADGREAEL
eukprot:g17687.t1